MYLPVFVNAFSHFRNFFEASIKYAAFQRTSPIPLAKEQIDGRCRKMNILNIDGGYARADSLLRSARMRGTKTNNREWEPSIHLEALCQNKASYQASARETYQ